MKFFGILYGIDFSIMMILRLTEIVVIYDFDAYLIHIGRLNLSELMAIVFTMPIMTEGLNVLAELTATVNIISANAKEVYEIIDVSDCDIVKSGNDEKIENNIAVKLDHVSFKFGEKTILKDVNIKIMNGEKVLITGKNGQDKSTLLKCITGLYSSEGASIILNGERLCNKTLTLTSSKKIKLSYLHVTIRTP